MAEQALQISLTVTPLVGAALGLAFWSNPRRLKQWSLLVAIASGLLLLGLAGRLTAPAENMLPLILLPIAASLTLLGQPVHPDNRQAWLMTLALLGLGLGVLASHDRPGAIFLLVLFGLVAGLLYRYRAMSGSVPWWGIGTCGFGMIGLLLSLVAPPAVSAGALLMVCAILLPLPPLHGGYVAAFRGLPGNLPAFLALLLPSLGFHRLVGVMPSLTEPLVEALVLPAMAGMLYGSLKALTQSRVRLLLAYAGLSFFSILWWYVAATRTVPPQAGVYLCSVGLATGGLLLAWHAIQARYGEVDLRAVTGLVYRMPRFAVLVSLLALAAMGLPPFGLFSGFLGMLLAPSLPRSGAWLVVLGAWLAASWYILDMAQGLLFGRQRSDLRYTDLRRAEVASLALCLLLLIALGLTPARFFQPAIATPQVRTAMESLSWNR